MLNKILCVDDDQVTLILCKILMEKASFCNEVDEAGNGQVALAYIERALVKGDGSIPQLIVLDINMPVMNGWEFLDEYTEKYAANVPAPVIILLSNVTNDDQEKAKTYPCVIDFLQKPLSIASLEKLKSIDGLSRHFSAVAR